MLSWNWNALIPVTHDAGIRSRDLADPETKMGNTVPVGAWRASFSIVEMVKMAEIKSKMAEIKSKMAEIKSKNNEI
jgi:hypothetical protein